MSTINNKRQTRSARVRLKSKGHSDRLRLHVFRSNRHMYAQIIDDQKGVTLVSCSEKELKDQKGTKTDRAKLVGQLIAKKAKTKKIKKVRFDRGWYQYHGRVKSLAEAAREGGLEF